MRVRKAIIPAAGLGTRLLPNTKSIPKEMLPLVDKPVIQYIVEEAVSAGVEQVLIITNRGKSAIENYFDYAPDLEERLRADGKERDADIIHRMWSKFMLNVGVNQVVMACEGTYGAGGGVVDAPESLDSECQSERQRHNARGDAAENIALQIVRLDKCHISI